jgi:hypothetical protein
MHYSFFCVLPDSRTFVLKHEENVLGTLSFFVDSPCGLPIDHTFQDLMAPLRGLGRRLAEVSLLALDQEAFRKKSFSLTDYKKLIGAFQLFKVMFDYARFVAQASDMVIAVHPKHEDLYRYLTFEIIGSPRRYVAARGKPALPMRLDIAKSVAKVPPKGVLARYFVNPITPVEVLTQHFSWDARSLREFLIDRLPLWEKLSTEQRQYIKSRYPDFRP